MTETDPTVEQIDMYIKGFCFPYTGATLYIMIDENTATAKQYNKKPGKVNQKTASTRLSEYHTGIHGVMQYLIDSLYFLVRRGMENDYNRSRKADGTA